MSQEAAVLDAELSSHRKWSNACLLWCFANRLVWKTEKLGLSWRKLHRDFCRHGNHPATTTLHRRIREPPGALTSWFFFQERLSNVSQICKPGISFKSASLEELALLPATPFAHIRIFFNCFSISLFSWWSRNEILASHKWAVSEMLKPCSSLPAERQRASVCFKQRDSQGTA